MLDGLPKPITITIAAHGAVGSSQMAFRRRRFLARLLALDAKTTPDSELCNIWQEQAR